jgi:hemoglobin
VTLYDDLGGAAAVTAAVDLFYEKVVADPSLTSYFDGIEMPKLKGHQRAFMTVALGGPDGYMGRPLGAAHAPLAITPDAFAAVVGHLADTLAELGVDEPTIGVIAEQLAPLEAEIVTAESVA